MRLTASWAATLGRALAKRGSHPQGPTTPTRNQAACAGQGSKHRATRTGRRKPWMPRRSGGFTGGGKNDGSGALSGVCFHVWGRMMKARCCDFISRFTTSRAHKNLEEDSLKELLLWNNEGLGEKSTDDLSTFLHFSAHNHQCSCHPFR